MYYQGTATQRQGERAPEINNNETTTEPLTCTEAQYWFKGANHRPHHHKIKVQENCRGKYFMFMVEKNNLLGSAYRHVLRQR